MDYEKLELMKTVYDEKTAETARKYGILDEKKDLMFIDYFINAVNAKCANGFRFNGIVIGDEYDYLIFEKTDKSIHYKVTQYATDVLDMHCQVFLPKVSDFPFYFSSTEEQTTIDLKVDLEEIYKQSTGKSASVAGKLTNAYKEWSEGKI